MDSSLACRTPWLSRGAAQPVSGFQQISDYLCWLPLEPDVDEVPLPLLPAPAPAPELPEPLVPEGPEVAVLEPPVPEVLSLEPVLPPVDPPLPLLLPVVEPLVLGEVLLPLPPLLLPEEPDWLPEACELLEESEGVSVPLLPCVALLLLPVESCPWLPWPWPWRLLRHWPNSSENLP